MVGPLSVRLRLRRSRVVAYSVGVTTADEWTLARTFDSGDGTVAWDVLGEGPPVVLVHGTPSWSYLWRHVARPLAASRAVYVYDLLGYGTSEQRDGQKVSIARQAELLDDLLHATIPGSRFELVPDAGHFAMEDNPHAVTVALNACLSA